MEQLNYPKNCSKIYKLTRSVNKEDVLLAFNMLLKFDALHLLKFFEDWAKDAFAYKTSFAIDLNCFIGTENGHQYYKKGDYYLLLANSSIFLDSFENYSYHILINGKYKQVKDE